MTDTINPTLTQNITPTDYQVLLFYKYNYIENPESFRLQQRAWCEELGLTGRTLIAFEGINSTLEGTVKSTEEYIDRISKIQGFGDIHWKKSIGTGSSFPKLSIKVRDEIVTTLINEKHEIGPLRRVTGKYLTPKELNTWIHSDKEFYIVDMRNDYEHAVGYFQNSILPNMLKNFRDLPAILPLLDNLKDKTIVTVCTGGIRCEKASGFLIHNGFADVYQLAGGIVSYMEEFPNQDFLGKLYVFDNRLTIGFNTDSLDHIIVGKCEVCGIQSENVIDYKTPDAPIRKHGPVCQECLRQEKAFLD
jgi:UPF0176 protein